MAEPERVLASQSRSRLPKELAPHELLQVTASRLASLLWEEFDDRIERRLLADDSNALEDRPLAGSEPLDAGGEERLDRRREWEVRLAVAASAVSIAASCSRKSGLPSAASSPLLVSRPKRRGRMPRLSRSSSASASVKRCELERRRISLAPSPGRSCLEQFGTPHTQQENWRVGGEVDEVLDEIEERRLGPMEILEDDDDGVRSRRRLQELSCGDEDLVGLRHGLAETDGRTHSVDDPVRIGLAVHDVEELGALRWPGLAENELTERPEGDSFAVRKAPAVQHRGSGGKQRRQLQREPRLPDPGRAEEGDELEATLANGAVEGAAQLDELNVSADERCLEATRKGGCVLAYVNEPPRGHGTRASPSLRERGATRPGPRLQRDGRLPRRGARLPARPPARAVQR